MKKILISTFIILVLVVIVFAIYLAVPRDTTSNEFNPGSAAVGEAVSGAGFKTYAGSGVSFQYPEGYTVGTIAETNSESILVQKTGEAKAETGLQIFSFPFDEDVKELTPERIHKDVPTMEMSDPKPIDIGGTKGLYFRSRSELGETHEFWVVSGGTFYQLSAPIQAGTLVETVINSLQLTQ
jgi:hypothetical protein